MLQVELKGLSSFIEENLFLFDFHILPDLGLPLGITILLSGSFNVLDFAIFSAKFKV